MDRTGEHQFDFQSFYRKTVNITGSNGCIDVDSGFCCGQVEDACDR